MSKRTETRSDRVIPFLKWAGGKRWLVAKSPELFDIPFTRYVEPFLGSGAVFFHLAPKRSVLTDRNSELITTYSAIRDDWRAVWTRLRRHHRHHSKDYYYQLRSSTPRSPAGIAARLIYLNRTCWNGLYRVNLSGAFNVPIGTKTDAIYETDCFESVSQMLKSASLKSCDFSKTLDNTGDGDFVFVDPPYTVRHDNNGFIKYNDSLFSWEDQERLRDAVVDSRARGARVLVTNASHPSIEKLYRGIGQHVRLSRSSVIAGASEFRGPCHEMAIKCF
ncbi:MAG: DNA adenine methylase [Phycisphaerales bacterium]